MLLLNQKFTRAHWLCFILMVVGHVLVQMASMKAPRFSPSASIQPPHHMLGVMYMLTSGCCVALASVRVERMLQTHQAFIYRNAHLAGYSLLSASSIYLWQTHFCLVSFFRGNNLLVWSLVILQAIGGFLVAWYVSPTSTVTKNNAQVLGFVLASIIPLLAPRSVSLQVC